METAPIRTTGCKAPLVSVLQNTCRTNLKGSGVACACEEVGAPEFLAKRACAILSGRSLPAINGDVPLRPWWRLGGSPLGRSKAKFCAILDNMTQPAKAEVCRERRRLTEALIAEMDNVTSLADRYRNALVRYASIEEIKTISDDFERAIRFRATLIERYQSHTEAHGC